MNSLLGPILRLLIVGMCLIQLAGCGGQDRAGAAHDEGRILILGMDGMDPILLQRYMDEEKLPHFKQLAEQGHFKPLATSMPPQSPVAWANVISGCDPGVHEIYDFIHRKPNLAFYLSTTVVDEPKEFRFLPSRIPLGQWQLPLSGQKPRLMRKGPTFWQYLVAQGIDMTVYRMPGNYPVQHVKGPGLFQCLAGMGTPDVLGGYGSFTVFTADAPLRGRNANGGRFEFIWAENHRAEARLTGPRNFLRRPKNGVQPPTTTQFQVVRDPERDLVKLTLGDDLLILKKGEWSRWVQFDFETNIPGSTVLGWTGASVSIPAMVRFYVKHVHPELEIFVTPANIDPFRPVNPISEPEGFARELAHRTGPYFTAGIPEHPPEVRQNAINEDQWLGKAHLILKERMRQFDLALESFKSGCLFFYFGSPDLLSHIFWRDQDPKHPRHQFLMELELSNQDSLNQMNISPQLLRSFKTKVALTANATVSIQEMNHRWQIKDGKDIYRIRTSGKKLHVYTDRYANVIQDVYVDMDRIVGQALEYIEPSDTLIIMSDHGFCSFRREFSLNTWLSQNGYMTLRNPNVLKSDFLSNVDWSRTKAYAVGLNGLYINLAGREVYGIVQPGAELNSLLDEISQKLLQVRDDDGSQVVAKMYQVQKIYKQADPKLAPDLLMGYARNYRASWSTTLGGMTATLIKDNLDRWSGDHCIAAELVPGIIVSNRKIKIDDPALTDLGPSILHLFGLDHPQEMTGRPIFEP